MPAETPFEAAIVTADTAEMLTDALFEDGLPRHELEAQSVLDPGEAPAGEGGDARYLGGITSTHKGARQNNELEKEE